jgi:hypothetical protein
LAVGWAGVSPFDVAKQEQFLCQTWKKSRGTLQVV